MFKKLFNNEAGVSPIVATLVLVVVAIAGAAAVGTIMGSFSSDVSNQANVGDSSSAASAEILVAGSTTVQPVSELLAEAYMDSHAGVKVTVQGGGSGAGVSSAGLGIVDIGSASRAVKDEEISKYPDLKTYTIGGSAVVAITNDAAASAALTKADLVTMYNAVDDTTAIDTIAGLFSTPGDVTVYQRTEVSGTEETFATYLTGASDVDDAVVDNGATYKSVMKNAVGNAGVLAAVKGATTNTVGFVDYGFAKDVSGVEIVDLGFTISDSNIKSAIKSKMAGETSTAYDTDLCRPLNYVINGQPSTVVNNYLTFAMSPGAIDIFHEAGYYAINELV
ncbi:phosphate ABC transporter substrate-binding protein, PhoT family [Methanolobus vulcani]|uniref:Phosphate ABC transporter substrate-binding protein, PhoT family n=1 Tax=Methanolobus vulcani TaxID=38026 RepID=A0A7Z7FEQ0_9EURY|nr:substrate-binding domain-containing protein [Methanolobus vulcani]SDF94439.1 phosphate ABC transporter substrate-binding protein, PhoT family [Methanolobus vulcani]